MIHWIKCLVFIPDILFWLQLVDELISHEYLLRSSYVLIIIMSLAVQRDNRK